VENWAAAGFWQQLEDGLMKIKQKRLPQLRLAFFTWHNRVEGQHAGHTMEELEEVYFNPDFDRAKFFQGGREILEAVAAFWEGLEADRRRGIQQEGLPVQPAGHAPAPSGSNEERLNWDASIPNAPSRPAGTVTVQLQDGGRSKPLPVPDPAAE